MNEEKLKRFYDNSIEYFDLPDFNTFKSEMKNDSNLARLRENMLPYYDLPELEVMKTDFFSGGLTGKSGKGKTTGTLEVDEVDEEVIEEPVEEQKPDEIGFELKDVTTPGTLPGTTQTITLAVPIGSESLEGLSKDQLFEKYTSGEIDIFTEESVGKMFEIQEDQEDAGAFSIDKPLRQRAPGLYNYWKQTGNVDLDLMPNSLRALSPNLKPLLGKEAKYAPEEEEKQKLIIDSKALDNLEKKYTDSTTLSDKEKETKLNWIKNKRDEITKQLSFPEKPGFWESTGNSLARGFNSFGKGVVNFAEMGIINAQDQALTIHEILRGEDVDPEVRKAWLKNAKSELDSNLGMPVVDIMNDIYTGGIEQFDEESITDEITEGNISNAVKRIVYGVSESAPSLLLASTGVGGIVALGASAAGNSFDENFEDSIDNGTSLQMLTFSSMGSGAIEAGFELVTRGVMKKANLLVGEGKEKAARELVDSFGKRVLTQYAVEPGKEGLSEAATELSNDIWKAATLGQEFDISKSWKNYIDAGLIGFGSGTSIVTGGYLKNPNQAVQEAARYKLMPDSDKKIINESAKNINELHSQLKQIDDDVSLSEDEKAGQAATIIEEMKNQANDVTKIKARFKQDLNYMNPDELLEYGKNADKINKARKGLNSPSIFYKNKSEQEINEATAQNDNFLRESSNRRLVEQTKTVGREAEKIGKTANTLNTSQEYQEAYDNTEIGKKNSMNVTNSDGFFDPNGNIYINKEVAQKVKAVNVAAHELLHGILRNSFTEPGSLNKVVNEFKSVLPIEALEKIEKRIDDNYRYENFKSEDEISPEKRKEIKTLKKNEDGTITAELKEEVYNEEYITAFADLIGTRQIKFNENIFQKIGGFFTPIFKGKGYSRIEFNTGKDVYDFVKNYQKQIEKGELQQDIIDIAKKGVKGKLVTDAAKFSKTEKVDVKQVSPKQVQTMVDKVANRAWSKFGKPIPANVKQKAGVTRQSYIESAKTELQQIAKEFDPKKTDKDGNPIDFNRFMANRGMQRMNSLASRLGVESSEKPTSKRLGQAVKEGEKEFDIKSEDATPEEAMISKEVGTEARKGIKLAERLGDDAKKISDKVKKMKPVLEGKTYKTLKDLAPDDTQRMFGIKPKPGNLTKDDVRNAQAFIRKNADILLAMLPEGTTISGKATGLQKVLLDPFYTKGRRVKAAKTGSTQGLATQNKKPNIKASEFLEVFGITPAGQPNVSDRNTSARIKALVDQTGKLLTNQAVREAMPDAPVEITEGKSRVMFSKQKPNKAEQRKIDAEIKLFDADPGTQVLAENRNFDEILEQHGIKPIDLNTQEGKDELKVRIFEGTETAAPFMTIIPESVLTTGTLSNGGLNESTRPRKVLADTKAGRELLIKMRESGFFGKGKPSNSEVERTYTLTDGSKIKNTDPKFLTEDIQLRIAPVGRFLFANKLQIDNAIAEAKAKGHEFAPENSKIAMAVKRQGYTAKLLKEMKEPGFFEKQMEKRDGLKDLIMVFDEAVQFNKIEYLPVVAGLLSATSGSQGHLGRTGSIVEFYNTLDLKNVEEHTEPASDLMKFFVNRMAQGNLNEYIDPALDSFFQGALPEVYDGMLKGTGKDGEKFNYIKNVPAEYIADVLLGLKPVWIRYFNPNVNSQIRVDEKGNVHKGINPNVIILSNGKSIAENFGLKVDNKFLNPEVLALQQKLLFEIFNGDITQEVAKERLQEALPVEVSKNKTNQKVNVPLVDSPKVMDTKDSENMTSEDVLNKAASLDEALRNARNPNAPVKKIRVFDFDDTLARTKSNVLYTMPDGTTGKLTAEEFAKRGDSILEQGGEFDFSEFNKVIDGKKGPLFEVAKKIQDTRGTEDLFVLTARAQEASPAIKEFLDAIGLNIPLKNISGLGNSSPFAKSNWVVDKAAEGYNDFYFADDHSANVKAVSEAMSLMDVKSKTQLAKQNNIKFSKSLVKKLNWKTDEASNMTSNFKIKDKSYLVRLYPVDKKGDYRYEFELETETGSTQGITGTGNAISVFSTVYNGLVDAINSNSKIKRVEFSADKSEPSRVKVYTSVMERLSKDLGWNTDIWETTDWDGGGSFDFEITKPRKKQPAPVEKVLNVIDVKSETQKAKIKFSKDLNMEFNEIIEQSKGIDKFKVYSDVKAQLAGARKGRGKFFIPPSAEDFQGLLYAMLGKGKQGTEQMQFFDEALNKPYARAMENLATDRVNLMADFKALKKQLEVPKDLRKKTKSGFTNEQAVRVYLWAKTGQEIPGLSKKDFKELNDIVENNPKLKVFADQMLSITKGDGYSTPKAAWQLGTITTDLIDVLNTNKRSKYLQEWQANVDTIFSKDNMNKLEAALGPKYVEALRNSLSRMKAGRNRIAGGNRLSNQVLNYINQSTGVTMFFNARSALLQTISAANFINWSFNNPLNAGKAFANQPQYWKDFTMLMNSDYLVDRRNGLKLNINESEIADAAKTSTNKAKAVLNYILEKGYIPTKYADSFAIASGGAMFYRNRVNNLIKKGMSIADAEAQAMEEFKATSEVSQQSSDPSKISQQQSGDMGRIILQYVNTPMQYARVQKRDMQDIINRRPMPGKTLAQSNRTRLSRITYYAFLQNMLFNALQQGLFAMGFGDDDEEMSESDEKRIFNTANGMMDSWLRGLGFAGVTVQVLKNLGINIYDRSQRDRPEYSDAWQKLLEFSPAIKSKLSKLRSAGYPFDSKKRRQEVFDKGFSLDNPAYESLAKVITATTNIPLDRLFSKINNIKGALEDDQESWKSVAMLLGWPEWQLEDKEDSKPKTPEEKAVVKEDKKEARYKAAVGSTDYDTIKDLTAPQQIKLMKSLGIDSDTIKKAKSEDAKIKLIIKKHSGEEPTEEEKKEIAKQKKFDEYKALTKKDQVEKLLELGLTKAQIRALKYEKDRVNKLIELEE